MGHDNLGKWCGSLALALAVCACASGPARGTDAAALRAYADAHWDKAALMHTTVELGRYGGVPVVAQFPCSDVCPQYTVRIIHYRLPPGVTCEAADGVRRDVLVPIAITVRTTSFCIPKPLLDGNRYYAK